VEDFADQVVGDGAVVAGELGEEGFVVGGSLQAEGGQSEACGPSSGAAVQDFDLAWC
jgi:hypothetical protein